MKNPQKLFALSLLALLLSACAGTSDSPVKFPVIDGEWWQVAGNPMDHKYATSRQEPVDFAVWQAADGTWQIWSCMRKTSSGGEDGRTRFFYRWEGQNLTDTDWAPMGLAMDADPAFGETPGGLQAPHVIRIGDTYHMFYGDWVNICHAVSQDGKEFTRVIQDHGKAGMFSEGPDAHTRDVMLLPYEGLWYAYYTGRTEGTGKIWVRTTPDFLTWSQPTIVSAGGIAGTGTGSHECPQVVNLEGNDFYLIKTKTYGDYDRAADDIRNLGLPLAYVYFSHDPKMFGIDQDEEYYLGSLEVAAPEIVLDEGQYYIFALNTLQLDGLRCARLKWEPLSD